MNAFIPPGPVASLHPYVMNPLGVPQAVASSNSPIPQSHIDHFQSLPMVLTQQHLQNQQVWLPNRLGKMLAPLHWHDYKKHYGKLDDFVARHPEVDGAAAINAGDSSDKRTQIFIRQDEQPNGVFWGWLNFKEIVSACLLKS
ncbi:hypothetical protein BHM03_00013323 [Ensete ventricosum]|nr:hypothetical protein BHM03_00013323 [Ensete ventricosum]